MAIFRPFRALRPTKEEAPKVAALPYDVVTRQEAAEVGKRNPHSFLHVDCAEIDLDEKIDSYDPAVYEQAAKALKELEEQGVLVQDQKNAYYIYQLRRGKKIQTGVVGVSGIDDYLDGTVKRHELTRKEKEEDRIRHVEACQAHTGPIFFTYRKKEEITSLLEEWMSSHEPVYDFVDAQEIGQKVWVIADDGIVERLQQAFQKVENFYIADGHHRAAAAVQVGLKRRQENPDYTGEEPFNEYLAVAFPEDELTILPYNRVIRDLNGRTVKAFLGAVKFHFELMLMPGGFPCMPMERHCMGMYVDGQWYHLKAWPDVYEGKSPVHQLDVELLQEKLLGPVLGIENPRVDERISFHGGNIRLKELAKLADATGGVVFAMYPTSMWELMDIADAGEIMPPKSTWFEPKLRSGLFIHKM